MAAKARAFTLIPSVAASTAAAFVSASTAPFVAA